MTLAYQYDRAGLYDGETEADESPMEPGVYLIPANSTLVAPPAEVPAGKWPRWNGSGWDVVNLPNKKPPPDAAEKLREFLAANPDVMAIVNNGGSV